MNISEALEHMPVARYSQNEEWDSLSRPLWNRFPQRSDMDDRGPVARMMEATDGIRQLTPEEEVRLGEQIAATRHYIEEYIEASRINPNDLATGSIRMPDELQEQFRIFHDAVNTLTLANMWQIGYVFSQHPGFYQDKDDSGVASLYEHGFFELWKSAKRFNPWFYEKEGDVRYQTIQPSRFDTLSVTNIYFGMLDAFDESYHMHIPAWRLDQLTRYNDARALCQSRLGTVDFETVITVMLTWQKVHHSPSEAEIQRSVKEIGENENAMTAYKRSLRSTEKLLTILDAVSLDELFRGKEFRDDQTGEFESAHVSLHDVLVSGNDVVRDVERHVRDELIHSILDRIWPVDADGVMSRDREVLELRFLSDKKYTLEEIALLWNVTSGAVRQRQNKVLSRLLHPKFRRMLRDFLED